MSSPEAARRSRTIFRMQTVGHNMSMKVDRRVLSMQHTVHCLTLHFIDSFVFRDEEVEFLVRVCHGPYLIILRDIVSSRHSLLVPRAIAWLKWMRRDGKRSSPKSLEIWRKFGIFGQTGAKPSKHPENCCKYVASYVEGYEQRYAKL